MKACRAARLRRGLASARQAPSADRRCAGWVATAVLSRKAAIGCRGAPRLMVIRALLVEEPDITLPELKVRLAQSGAVVSVAALWRFCKRHKLTRKKRLRTRASRIGSDVLRREEWFESQLDLDPELLVFIDETWTSTKMACTHGRRARGEQLRASVPHGHEVVIAVLLVYKPDRRISYLEFCRHWRGA